MPRAAFRVAPSAKVSLGIGYAEGKAIGRVQVGPALTPNGRLGYADGQAVGI